MQELVDQINHYNHAYYQLNESLISDEAFDKLLAELQKLEFENPLFALPDSPTKRVGGTVTKNFQSVNHQFPMLSLGNTYNESDLRDFDERIQKALENESYEYICELKFDGVALSFWYEDGKLIKGVTRGDGTRGDDITNNVKTIQSIPHYISSNDLPKQFEVRGEGYMPITSFDKINAEKLPMERLLWQIHAMRLRELLSYRIQVLYPNETWHALSMPTLGTKYRFKPMKKDYCYSKRTDSPYHRPTVNAKI